MTSTFGYGQITGAEYKMKSNAFITEGHPFKSFEVAVYSPKGVIDPQDIYKVTKGLERRLLYRGKPAAAFGDRVVVLSEPHRLNDIEKTGQYEFVLLPDKKELTAESQGGVIQNMVANYFTRMAGRMGYDKAGQKLYATEPFKRDVFAYHDAFLFDLEVQPDGSAILWLDVTTKWTQTLTGFIDLLQKNGYSNDEIAEEITGRQVHCPSVSKGSTFKATVDSVIFETAGQHVIEDLGKSVADLWQEPMYAQYLRRNDLQVLAANTPLVRVRLAHKGKVITYPSSVLSMVIDLADIARFNANPEKKVCRPGERIKDVRALKNKLVGDGFRFGDMNVTFKDEMLDWTSSPGSAYGRLVKFKPPQLRFGGGNVGVKWNDPYGEVPIMSCMRQHGPVTRKDEVTVLTVVPQRAADGVERFISRLNASASQLKLGTFRNIDTVMLTRGTPDEYNIACRSLEKADDADVVMVILPQANADKAYISAKKGLGATLTKSQMLNYSTFRNIVTSTRDFITNNLAAETYEKSLRPGESMWHLANPAGGIPADRRVFFMGFDVSRTPGERKEAAGYVAICDNFGIITHRQVIKSHKGERVSASVLSDWFFEVAVSTSLASRGAKEAVDELILFKDGPIHPNQVKDYREGALNAKERLMSEGIMNEDGNIRVVAVVKSGPHRIFGEPPQYEALNTAIIRDSRRALMATAKTAIGTADPLRFDLVYQIKDDMTIEGILHMFNDLRYLDWDSLYRQPKTIMPLHIVQNLAKLGKEDINVPYIPR